MDFISIRHMGHLCIHPLINPAARHIHIDHIIDLLNFIDNSTNIDSYYKASMVGVILDFLNNSNTFVFPLSSIDVGSMYVANTDFTYWTARYGR